MVHQTARFLFSLGICCSPLLGSPEIATAEAIREGLCLDQLAPAITTIAQQPILKRARLGILVQPLEPGRPPLYRRDAQHLFVPASNVKLLTSAAGLTALGPQFQFKTNVYGAGDGPQLTHLRIVGGGDPTFSDAQLRQIAQELQHQGVQHIHQLIGDDSTFLGPQVVPSWEWEDLHAGYGAPVNSLILNQNAYVLKLWPQNTGQPLRVEWVSAQPDRPWRLLNRSQTVAPSASEFLDVVRTVNNSILDLEIRGQLRTGAEPDEIDIAVVDPGWYLIRRLRSILADHQISVGQLTLIANPIGKVKTFNPQLSERLWLTLRSPPLAELIKTINQQSNNLYAEALLRVLGTQRAPRSDQPNPSARKQGIAVLTQTLNQLGVASNTYGIADGSGLSRRNLVSPEAIVQVLQLMVQSQHAQVFQASLATAGVSGTLKHRFVNTSAQGLLQAKTGTLSGVSALSGYFNSPHVSPMAFSIVVNQYNQSKSDLTRIFDDLIATLTRLRPC